MTFWRIMLYLCSHWFTESNAVEAVTNYKSHVRVKWLFLHYHKTGALLSEAISKSVSVDKFLYKDDKSKRLDFSTVNTANVILSHGGNFLFNWTTTLVTSKFQYRVIHFVREPHDMVISGMLYHSQRPPPEQWLMSPDLSPCEMDPDQMDRFLSVLTSYHVKLSKQDLSLKIDRVRKLCESIYHKYSKVGGEPSTYAKTLHFMRGKRLFTEALQLEGCRALISSFIGAGGDIIRMGANAVREGQALKLVEAQQNLADSAPTLQSKKKKKKKQSYERNARKSLPMISLRFFLSDFPSDQRDVFESSLKRMFAFLMKTPESGSIPFWKEKLTPSEAVKTALQAGSLQSRKPSVSTSTASTRQLMMNGEESRNLSHISTKTHILGCCVSASGKIHRNATVIKVDRRSLEGDIEKSRRLGFKRSEFLARDAATLGRITSMTPIRGVTALSESRAGGGVYSNNQKKDGRGVVRQYSSFRSAEMRNSGKQSAYQDSIIGILSHEDNPLSINKKELRSRHVTRDRISEERRREYVGILANDAVLGPMLNLVRNILHFPLSHLSDGGTEFSLFNYTLI